ncbi:hypothetical protein [Marinobacter nauticus]|uniref:hypothetical protein n=1 Tax=Marinobacter nauticus TaxID=2743 RepID=UPI0040439903
MIGQDDPLSMIRALDKIRKNSSEREYQLVIEVLRNSRLFKRDSITGYFVKECPNILNKDLVYPPQNLVEIINENRDKLWSIVSEYEELLAEVCLKNYSESMRVVNRLIDSGGVSLFLIRVLYFMRNHFSQRDSASVTVNEVLSRIRIDRTSYLQKVIKELSNPRTDYLTICKKIYRIEEKTPISIVSKSFVDHIPRSFKEFKWCLAANYSFSLVDAFLYLCSMRRLGNNFTSRYEGVDEDLVRLFDQLSEVRFVPDMFYDMGSDSADTEFFKETFLLIEINSVFRYKTVHGSLYNENEVADHGRLPFERDIIRDYFKNVSKLRDIRSAEDKEAVSLIEYVPGVNKFLENSTALLFHIERTSGDIEDEESYFVELMSMTKDIGLTTATYHLDRLAENGRAEDFKLVVACLRSIKDSGMIAEHDLRRLIQDVTVSLHGSDIISLLDYMYSVSPSVTEHLIHLCDEMFLSKLFDVIKIPNDAIWTRARILEWYGEKTNDQSFVERAKNLRIDVQINREKGTIDDSRIYVDPLKYTQWLNDNIINNALILLDDISNSGYLPTLNINWAGAESGLSAVDQLASLLLKSYREFCNNKYFGIASYLGRRIRHGTFKGTGMKEVREMRKSSKYQELFEFSEFRLYFDDWLSRYEEMFDRLASDCLHIQSKTKPDGIISCYITSTNKIKIANYMVKEVIESYVRNDNSLEIPYIITDYCWRLVEEDLVAVRKDLMSVKAKWAVFGYNGKFIEVLKSKGLNEFCQEINTITADRFRTISSWFSKPSIASPSADLHLLFRAVVSEIKSYFSDFEPDVIYEQGELVITGGAYFVIYDALYIIIYNAAKYGDPTGKLLFEVKYDLASELKRVRISITSDISKQDSMERIKRDVEYAASLNFDDAHLIEGRSGIKKLKRMEYDKCIYDVDFCYGDSTLSVCFDFGVDY